jgi:membrane protein involved in colicin uptake
MRATKAEAADKATREKAAAGARLCRKMAAHCRRAASFDAERRLDRSGLEDLLVANGQA